MAGPEDERPELRCREVDTSRWMKLIKKRHAKVEETCYDREDMSSGGPNKVE